MALQQFSGCLYSINSLFMGDIVTFSVSLNNGCVRGAMASSAAEDSNVSCKGRDPSGTSECIYTHSSNILIIDFKLMTCWQIIPSN